MYYMSVRDISSIEICAPVHHVLLSYPDQGAITVIHQAFYPLLVMLIPLVIYLRLHKRLRIQFTFLYNNMNYEVARESWLYSVHIIQYYYIVWGPLCSSFRTVAELPCSVALHRRRSLL